MNLNAFFAPSFQPISDVSVKSAEAVPANNSSTLIVASAEAKQFLSDLGLRIDTNKGALVDKHDHVILNLSQHPSTDRKFSFVSLKQKDRSNLEMKATYQNGGSEDFTLSKQALQALQSGHNH